MNKKIKITMTISLSLVFASVLFLVGCSSTKKNVSVYLEKPASVNAPTREQIIQVLQNTEVPVLQKSDEMVIVLSNDKLFQKKSSQLKPGNSRLLQVITLLMRKDQKVSVEIVSYADDAYAVLAQEQTRYLAQRLWQYGIDARVIHTKSVITTQLPWECGRFNHCTLIRYHYFPKIMPYN